MSVERSLGHIAGLELLIRRSFFLGSFLLCLLIGALYFWFSESTAIGAIGVGLAATFLYWFAELVHQVGHAYFARQAGYPMAGIRFGTMLIFSTSLYPRDEGPLPARIHIRRALGGPVASVLLGALAGIAALALGPTAGPGGLLATFLFAVSFGWLGLGALVPLGFTDGSTLLKWSGKQRRRPS